jgi:mannosyltransferase
VKIHFGVAPGSNPTSAVAPDPVGMAAIIGIAVVASLGLLPWLGSSMFADEGATLYSAHLSWSNLWAQSQHVDLVLLPYYALVHFWVLVSGNIAWVRALSLLAYFGTIVVVSWTGLRIAGRWCGIITAVLTATSSLLVEKSLNARPYTLSTLLVVLCAVSLLKWLDDSRTRWLWVFGILALLATAMQLFSLLAPAAMLFGILVVRPELIRQRLRALRAPIVLLALASGTWVVACMREVGQVNWIAYESTESRLLEEVRGPVIGQTYDFLLFVLVVVIVTKLAIVWNRDVRTAVFEQVSRDRDVLALTISWAIIPTVVLSIVSFAHPIFSVRYVAASAPGAALLVAFICVRAFPKSLDPSRAADQMANRNRWNRMTVAFGSVAVVLLVVGAVGSASTLQEDLQSPARYLAQHAQKGDVIALPDHAITSVIDYYLASDKRHLPLWQQLGVRQRYVEGFDLSLRPSDGFPRRVWVVSDDSVPGVTHFEKVLVQDGYVVENYKQFNGSTLLVYHSARPITAVIVPSSGATLRGTGVTLIAIASAYQGGISKIQFVLSGGSYAKTLIGTTSFTSFVAYLDWNSTSVPNGTYLLQSVATNGSGKISYSTAITINVDNGTEAASG